ncbi:MAG: hypothetical protein D3903_21095, partial [Candidatus Electrothrix sp. GM3_4]|nr:hypothetical protein [Candidatus Electrothrix sp. GM3_4]
ILGKGLFIFSMRQNRFQALLRLGVHMQFQLKHKSVLLFLFSVFSSDSRKIHPARCAVQRPFRVLQLLRREAEGIR